MNRRGGIAIAAAALVGGALAFSASTPAAASTVPLAFDFGVVLPGTTVSDTQQVTVARSSVVAAAEWTPRSGPAGITWTAQVCDAAGDCSDFTDLPGARVAAGTYTVTMSVTIPETVQQGDVATSDGFVQLVDQAGDSGMLAVTGGTAPWSFAVAGAALAGFGAFLVLRRRSKERTR